VYCLKQSQDKRDCIKQLSAVARVKLICVFVLVVKQDTKNTHSNRQVNNHMHGLIFELKERMNSRQDQPVISEKHCMC
jgi:hypothetical protein